MPIDLQTTYRDFPPPLLAQKRIRNRVEKLDRLFPRIISCHVVVEESHRSHHKGKLFSVRMNVTIPGGEIVATRDHHDKRDHEDFYAAMRDAFDALERQLRAHAERRRGEVKSHEKVFPTMSPSLFPNKHVSGPPKLGPTASWTNGQRPQKGAVSPMRTSLRSSRGQYSRAAS